MIRLAAAVTAKRPDAAWEPPPARICRPRPSAQVLARRSWPATFARTRNAPSTSAAMESVTPVRPTRVARRIARRPADAARWGPPTASSAAMRGAAVLPALRTAPARSCQMATGPREALARVSERLDGRVVRSASKQRGIGESRCPFDVLAKERAAGLRTAELARDGRRRRLGPENRGRREALVTPVERLAIVPGEVLMMVMPAVMIEA